MEKIGPRLDAISGVLARISQAADERGREIRQNLHWRHLLDKFIAVATGIFLILTLLYNDWLRRQTTKALRYNERLFSLLSATIDNVFIISNPTGTFEYVSSNSTRVLGLDSKASACLICPPIPSSFIRGWKMPAPSG
jgi:hypothetical protein